MKERQRIFYINHEEIRFIALIRLYQDAEARFILQAETGVNSHFDHKKLVFEDRDDKAQRLDRHFLGFAQSEIIEALMQEVKRLSGQEWLNGEPVKVGYRAWIHTEDIMKAMTEEADRIAAEKAEKIMDELRAAQPTTLEDRMKEFAREVAALENSYGFEICSEGNEKTVIIFEDAAYDWPDINK